MKQIKAIILFALVVEIGGKMKRCQHPGCIATTEKTFCKKHKRKDNRPSAHKRGYTKEWRSVSKIYLFNHKKCVKCGDKSTVVDHIEPHKGNKLLFWNIRNWQAMCKSCHDRKTATEDSNFLKR